MKMMTSAFVALALTIQAGVHAQAAQLAHSYDPQILVKIADRVTQSRKSGQTPIVIFDLDDTLINTRERNVRIIRDFASRPDTRAGFTQDSTKAARVTVADAGYQVSDTMKSVGVTNADFLAKLQAFWLPAFFSNDYCAHDVPNPGAVQYVKYLVHAGAKVVYLTGRDAPSMGKGTQYNLQQLGFPMDTNSALLMMKSDPKQEDLAFKMPQLSVIAKMGAVIASFENEPKNINAMQGALPQAAMVFVDTIHSPNPAVPNQGVFWVKDFAPPSAHSAR